MPLDQRGEAVQRRGQRLSKFRAASTFENHPPLLLGAEELINRNGPPGLLVVLPRRNQHRPRSAVKPAGEMSA